MTEASTPTARVVRSRSALAEAVARWSGSTFETTWSLVAVGEVPSAADLSALRHAAKLTDRVAAVVVGQGKAARILPTFATLLREAGCDVVWVPSADKPLLKLEGADGHDLRALLQALLAVLPGAVVASRHDATRVRHWRLLQTEFGDVVDLVLADAPSGVSGIGV